MKWLYGSRNLDLKGRLSSRTTTRYDKNGSEGHEDDMKGTERLGRDIQVDKLKGVVVCGSRTGSDRWGPQVPDLVSSAQAPLSHPPNLLSFLLRRATSPSNPSNSPPSQLHRFTPFLLRSTFLLPSTLPFPRVSYPSMCNVHSNVQPQPWRCVTHAWNVRITRVGNTRSGCQRIRLYEIGGIVKISMFSRYKLLKSAGIN